MIARLLMVLLSLFAAAGSTRSAEKKPLAPSAAATDVDLAYGAYQRRDYAVAMAEAQKRVAANPKDAAALTLIGQLYAEGAGAPIDGKKALEWYRRGADAGGADAAYRYGAAALIGKDMARNHGLARVYLEKAALQEHPAALHMLGELALENNGGPPDFQMAISYFRRAAAGGVPDSEYALAEFYKTGSGVPNDEKTAADWLKRASDHGFVPAMVELAIARFNGAGTERDPAGALQLFRKAAQMGNPVAQNRLAHLLAEGRAVEKNLAEAAQWNARARSSGLVDSSLDALLGSPPPTPGKSEHGGKSAAPGKP
jgi:TPR repeat protein